MHIAHGRQKTSKGIFIKQSSLLITSITGLGLHVRKVDDEEVQEFQVEKEIEVSEALVKAAEDFAKVRKTLDKHEKDVAQWVTF
jgi:hypothetical protein